MATRELESFDVDEDGVRVRVIPHYSAVNWRVRGEGQFRRWELFGLRAELETDVPGEIVRDDETRVSDVPSEVYWALHKPAFRALQKTLRHLRQVTNDPEIDVYLPTIALENVWDSNGRELFDRTFLPEDWILEHTSYELTKEAWQEVISATQASQIPPLGKEMLLNARAFFADGNYNMAVVNAAIACESLMKQIVMHKLLESGRVDRSRAESFASETSNAQLPTLLMYFGVADADLAKMIKDTRDSRNDIVHAKRKTSVSRVTAQSAVTAAGFLQQRYEELK